MNINDLYKKVEEFNNSLTDEFKSSLECKKGCNQCCYTDLSIFEVEAENILNEYSKLSATEQSAIQNKLNLSQELKDNISPCVFLRKDECVIYPFRPLICRTQGNAFLIKSEKEQFLDICPLNEKALDKIENSNILNLELLNTILSQLNTHLGYSGKRISLNGLAKRVRNDLP